jgi:hypothetical protein
MPRKQIIEKKVSPRKNVGRPRPSKVSSNDDYDHMPFSKKAIEKIENNYRQILEMQDKILSAPAMNGEFTTLLYKVENIEQFQEQLVQKVDQIHGALYEPDNGLYARVKNVENDCVSNETIDELEKEVQEIKIWKNSEEKQSEKEENAVVEKNKIMLEHEAALKDIQDSIAKYNAAIKWIAISLGGGLLSMIGKLIYEYVTGHIKIV